MIAVAKALKELKTIDDRIERATSEGVFIGIMRGGKDVGRRFKSKDEMAKAIQGSFDKIEQLRENRSKIKAAIIQSNAETKIDVAILGNVSVAQAIEYKSVIQERKSLLSRVRQQFLEVSNKAGQYELENQQTIDQRVNTALGNSQEGINPDLQKAISDSVEQERGFEIINPKNIEDWIQKELDLIEEFENNVDDAINESNVLTKIDIVL